MKNPKQLERYCKGVANHWRIAILALVGKYDGMTAEQIADELGGSIKTISQHTKVLVNAGLLNKSYVGRSVSHSLSPYGKRFLRFLRRF